MRARLTIRVRNAKMLDARNRLGLSMRSLAKIVGVDLTTLYKVQNFQVPKECTPKMLRIATALELSVEDLWSEEIAGVKPVTEISKDFTFKQFPALLAHHVDRFALPSGEDAAVMAETIQGLRSAVDKLPLRQRGILTARFGLDGEKPMTLEETGKAFRVTRERVRQLEAKARRIVGARMFRAGLAP